MKMNIDSSMLHTYVCTHSTTDSEEKVGGGTGKNNAQILFSVVDVVVSVRCACVCVPYMCVSTTLTTPLYITPHHAPYTHT
jgi:hypothetical protein